MHLSLTFWCKRFALQAAVWTIGMLVGIAVVVGLVYPTSRWLFADGWQWMPFERWMKYVLLCIPGGIFCGGLFTLGDWLEHGDAGPVRKVIVSSVVVASLVLICIVLAPRALSWVMPLLTI